MESTKLTLGLTQKLYHFKILILNHLHKSMPENQLPSTAYFSMEFGIRAEMKSYAGGLGILAGDTIKTAADMGLNFVGVTLLYKKGYFRQVINDQGIQLEEPDVWDHTKYLTNTEKIIEIKLKNESIFAEIWKYDVEGITGHKVPLYFLNTDIEKNQLSNQYISYNLYTPSDETRTKQEIVLGLGGIYALRAMGHTTFDNYHLNESHAAFSILELYKELKDIEIVKKHVVFTTHTPEEHGHKKYEISQLSNYFDDELMALLMQHSENGIVHMTKFCFKHAKYSNAVAKRHQEVSSKMFPDYKIDHITNGVHTSWVGKATRDLFSKYISDWETNPEKLKELPELSSEELLTMFHDNKASLIKYVRDRYGITIKDGVFTIGFGRRVDPYKRSSFIFTNIERLKSIAEKFGGLQIILSGKAYFDNQASEERIANIFKLSKTDLGKLNIIFLENYGMKISKYLVQGCDLWLNNPIKPREACGTSGMKAALNGVPSLSTIDGWWVEGLKEGETGWAIGDDTSVEVDENIELEDLYNKLESVIMPTHQNQEQWAKIMINSIRMNGSFFNTHRMLNEYIEKAYKL